MSSVFLNVFPASRRVDPLFDDLFRGVESVIQQYITVTNQRPTPLLWTKTADEILVSAARFFPRTLETGH